MLATDAPSAADLLRASTKVPGSAYKGAGTRALSSVLNGHLLRSEQYVAACEDWTPQEVQEFMGKIDAHRNAELQDIYEGARDRRRQTVAGSYAAHWQRMNSLVDGLPHLV